MREKLYKPSDGIINKADIDRVQDILQKQGVTSILLGDPPKSYYVLFYADEDGQPQKKFFPAEKI